jgi:hypothetical protein
MLDENARDDSDAEDGSAALDLRYFFTFDMNKRTRFFCTRNMLQVNFILLTSSLSTKAVISDC